jgi:hypothetical protein
LIRGSTSNGHVRCTGSDGRGTPARPASHVWNASVDVLRRTRRNAHTIRGAAPDVIHRTSCRGSRGSASQLTFTLDSNELLGQRKTRMAVRENSAPSRSWRSVACNAFGRQAEALMQEAKAGAFADSCERQRLEPSLTYNCERQRPEPSLTYNCERQRLEPSLTQLQEAKAGAFAYTTAEAKAGAFAYNSPMTLWRSIP